MNEMIAASVLSLELKEQPRRLTEKAKRKGSLAVPQNVATQEERKGMRKVQTVWSEVEFRRRQAQLDDRIRRMKRRLKSIRVQSVSRRGGDRGFQVLTLGLQGPALSEYLEALRRKVLERWYPLLLEAEHRLAPSEVRIDFILDASGRVVSHSIAEFKGGELFRDLSEQAFVHSAPFLPLPAKESGTREERQLKVSLFFYYQ